MKKSIFKKWWFWVIIIIVGIAVSQMGGKGPKKVMKSETSSETAAPEETKEAEKTEFTVGDTADFDGIQVTLTKAVASGGDGQFIKPDDGKKFVALFFEISTFFLSCTFPFAKSGN